MSTNIVVSPADVWVAPVGTTFPAISAAPSTTWVLLGSLGKDMEDEGVTITIDHSTESFFGQSVAPIKMWRTEREITVELAVADLRGEMVAAALGTTMVTGTGENTVAVPASISLQERAVLIRAVNGSPYDDTKNLQYEIPRAANISGLELVHSKGGVTLVKFTLKALRPTSGDIMTVRMGTP